MTFRWIAILLASLLLSSPLLLFSACGNDHDDEDEEDEDEDEDEEDDDQTEEGYFVVPPVDNQQPPWPEWVLRHWVWEDESTQDSAEALIEDYRNHEIPVGAIIIDSPWETGYNTFEFDPDRYPDPQGMIDGFHERDVRVFMWITPNVNVDSPNYEVGLNNGYYVNDGRTLSWWKGVGSFIDYTNPDAVAWWHGLLDPILDMGIDGWKTDETTVSLWRWLVVQTLAGPMSPKDYQRLYYYDFFNYTRARLGTNRVITARPVDAYGFQLFGLTHAPREVNLAGWVGDQDPDWNGLNEALVNLFLSAQEGYVNFGSDIGGYLGDGLRDKTLFVRWAQLGAFCPIMENGGAGEHRPWMYDHQTLEIYKTYTDLHHKLIPYLYSQGAESFERGISLMRPQEGQWNYLLGDNLLVSAIWQPGQTKDVRFPPGTWIDFWDYSEHAGGAVEQIDYPLDRYPVFIRKGAIVPMDMGRESPFLNSETETGNPITVTLYPGEEGAADEFDIYREKSSGARVTAEYGPSMRITLSATDDPYAFRILGRRAPDSVELERSGPLQQVESIERLKAAQSGWTYDMPRQAAWIKPGSAEKGLALIIR